MFTGNGDLALFLSLIKVNNQLECFWGIRWLELTLGLLGHGIFITTSGRLKAIFPYSTTRLTPRIL